MNLTNSVDQRVAYQVAFLDWLACATAGRDEAAPRSLAATGSDLFTNVAVVAAAGHVLDFDDTLPEGVAHISAATAPAALVLAAHLRLTIGSVLEAYAAGYEAMAAVAAASHPALYAAGWHPTTVCGPIGAATAAASLLDLDEAGRETALAVALLGTGGSRGAFGSDGKSIQVGLAAAAGVRAALAAQAGARVGDASLRGVYGFESVFGATIPENLWEKRADPAIERNWIKLHPTCLGTHAAIDAAAAIREFGAGSFDPLKNEIEVAVHPVGRQAAHLDLVSDGLAAKFSIPYCVAYTFLKGMPRRASFEALDQDVSALAATVRVTLDESLPEFGASLRSQGLELMTVPYPRGAPGSSASEAALESKIRDLTGRSLAGALANPGHSAASLLATAGFRFQ